jgi:hypothetical protein
MGGEQHEDKMKRYGLGHPRQLSGVIFIGTGLGHAAWERPSGSGKMHGDYDALDAAIAALRSADARGFRKKTRQRAC